MRRRSSPASSSETSSTQPAAAPRRRATVNSVAASISTATAPAAAQRAGALRVGVVEEVGRDDGDRVAGRARQRGGQARVGGGALAGAERAARPVRAQRLAGDEQVAEPRAVRERAAGPDPHEPPRAERDQLLGDDRRARPAHARALDRQRRAVGGRARVAPQPAVGVEHLHRRRQQVLGEAQRAPGVAGQQHALGDGRVRPEVDGSGRHEAPAMELDLRAPWRRRTRRSRRRTTSPADAVGAVRTAVERTFQATADSAQSTRTRAQDLVDEVAGAAGRVREMIEDIRVLEDLKRLRTEVETLTRRVAALEDKPAAAKPASSPRTPARRASSARRPDREGGRHRALDREVAVARGQAARPRPRSRARRRRSRARPPPSRAPRPPSRAPRRPRSPPPPDGLAAVRVRRRSSAR